MVYLVMQLNDKWSRCLITVAEHLACSDKQLRGLMRLLWGSVAFMWRFIFPKMGTVTLIPSPGHVYSMYLTCSHTHTHTPPRQTLYVLMPFGGLPVLLVAAGSFPLLCNNILGVSPSVNPWWTPGLAGFLPVWPAQGRPAHPAQQSPLHHWDPAGCTVGRARWIMTAFQGRHRLTSQSWTPR